MAIRRTTAAGSVVSPVSRLVIVTANQHTGYGVNVCSSDIIEQYLVDPVANAPTDGAECP